MTVAVIPNRPAGTDVRSIEAILANFDALTTAINGELDANNLSPAAAQSAMMNQSAQVVKGQVIIPATESRTNNTYGLLTTPDQVQNLVVPAGGLIEVSYRAVWQETIGGAARAAIFIGANQLQVATGAGPGAQAARTNGASISQDMPMSTFEAGLACNTQYATYTNDVTTGQALGTAVTGGFTTGIYHDVGGTALSVSRTTVGGPVYIDNLPAATYTISIQFLATTGTVQVRARRLRCRVISFT